MCVHYEGMRTLSVLVCTEMAGLETMTFVKEDLTAISTAQEQVCVFLSLSVCVSECVFLSVSVCAMAG